MLDFNLAENLALHDYGKPPFSRFGWLNPRRWIRSARKLLKERRNAAVGAVHRSCGVVPAGTRLRRP